MGQHSSTPNSWCSCSSEQLETFCTNLNTSSFNCCSRIFYCGHAHPFPHLENTHTVGMTTSLLCHAVTIRNSKGKGKCSCPIRLLLHCSCILESRFSPHYGIPSKTTIPITIEDLITVDLKLLFHK